MQDAAALAAPPQTAVLYRIDRLDTVVEIGGAWDDFARANGGAPEIVGRELWDFVSGDDVCAVWRTLLRYVRAEQEPLAFLYRCDAPGVRRLMQMELLPGDESDVLFRSQPVRTVNGPALSGTWADSHERGTVTVCGWCGRVRADDWVSPEAAIAALGLDAPSTRAPRLSHGICDSCARELRGLTRR